MIPDESTKAAIKDFCLLFCGKKRANACDISVEERPERCMRVARNIWKLGTTEVQQTLKERVDNGEVPP
jgi:hypothetical protein